MVELASDDQLLRVVTKEECEIFFWSYFCKGEIKHNYHHTGIHELAHERIKFISSQLCSETHIGSLKWDIVGYIHPLNWQILQINASFPLEF